MHRCDTVQAWEGVVLHGNNGIRFRGSVRVARGDHQRRVRRDELERLPAECILALEHLDQQLIRCLGSPAFPIPPPSEGNQTAEP